MRRIAVALALVVLLVGCGGQATPVESAASRVPALGERLEALDALVVAGQWTQARAEVRGIIRVANDAREAGDLGAAEADRVVASAQRLLAAFPVAPAATANPSPSATSSSRTPASSGKPGKGGKKHGKKG